MKPDPISLAKQRFIGNRLPRRGFEPVSSNYLPLPFTGLDTDWKYPACVPRRT